MKTKLETIEILKIGILVILAATIINVINYFVFSSLGVYDDVLNANTGNEIDVVEVIVSSILQAGIGLVVFILFVRYSENWLKNWRIIGTIVLFLSFGLPLTVQNANTLVIISLELMHVISGVGMLFVLPEMLTRNK